MLRFLLALPGLSVMVAFALSNPEPVRLGMWPFETTVELPLSVAILAVGAIFFMFGALLVWVPGLSARVRARRAEQRAARLEAQLQAQLQENAPRGRAVALIRN